MSFEKPYYFVAMVFSPLWEGPKWLEVALDANFASIRLDADQSKRFGLAQMQLTVANDQQKTWYLAWRDEMGKWAIGIHDTALQKQLQRTPPPALASQLNAATPSPESKTAAPATPKVSVPTISSKSLGKVFFLLFVMLVLVLSFRDKLIRWATMNFVGLDINQEMKLGDLVYRSLYKDIKIIQDPFVQSVLDDASRRLSRGALYSYAWVVINDDKAVEVDIIPGGIFLVPTGLLRRINNMDELYGVMASRMLLVEQRTPIQEIVAAAGWTAVLDLYKRNYSAAAIQLAPFIKGFIFNQQTVMLADRPAFVRLWIMNIDPNKWVEFLERQAKWQKRDPIASKTVHPITLARIAYLKEIDSRKPPGSKYIPSSCNWAEIEARLPKVNVKKLNAVTPASRSK